MFHVFSFFHQHLDPTVWISHFPRFLVFLIILQILQCAFLIFNFKFSCHIPDHKGFVSNFPWYSVFSPYSRSSSAHFSFSTFFSISHHIPGQTVFLSHFFTFFRDFKSYIVCFSLSIIFSFLAILQVLECAFLIFHVFECFSPWFTSYSVGFSFSMFFSFLAIIHVLQSQFPTCHVFSVSRHISSPTMCVSHFPWFSVLFISLFWPYSRSCGVHSSFSTFLVYLAIFHVIQCVFLVSMIFHFFTILQVLQCAFLISHFFQCF